MNWDDAVYGGVANVYRLQYPFIGEEGIDVINHEWTMIRFDDPLPALIAGNG